MTENNRNEQVKNEFLSLIANADTDNASAQEIVALRKFLQDNPELWSHAGNLAKKAAQKMILSANNCPSLTESLKIGYWQLQQDLAVGNVDMLEQILIEHVVLTWMRLYDVEIRYTEATTGSFTIKHGEYWEKRLNAAQRRFLRACTTLARVRKFGLPAMQINIADQQVNQLNS